MCGFVSRIKSRSLRWRQLQRWHLWCDFSYIFSYSFVGECSINKPMPWEYFYLMFFNFLGVLSGLWFRCVKHLQTVWQDWNEAKGRSSTGQWWTGWRKCLTPWFSFLFFFFLASRWHHTISTDGFDSRMLTCVYFEGISLSQVLFYIVFCIS